MDFKLRWILMVKILVILVKQRYSNGLWESKESDISSITREWASPYAVNHGKSINFFRKGTKNELLRSRVRVRVRVVFASNWDTSFREWHSPFKLGFVNSATITKMFNLSLEIRKTTNRVMCLHTCRSFLAALTMHVLHSDPRGQFVALLFANTRLKS